VVLTGTADEAGLVAALSSAIPYPVVNLAGRTTLWMLGALVENASQVVCNDTGLSHIAAALGTPSVVVSSGSDVERWGPLDRKRHRVLWQPMSCRPCTHVTCPIGHGCALAISVAEVMQTLADGAPTARPSSPATTTTAASTETAPASLP
jgi:ADP-heptose:LPS heptosyltransferase